MPPLERRSTLANGADYATIVLADSPTAYYRLDDTGSTAADSSGNGINGAIGASVTKSAPSLLSSTSDTAMAFPGGSATSAAIVTVPKNTKLQPASAVSVEAWIRFASVPTTYAAAVSYGSDGLYAPYDLFFRAGGALVAQFYTTAGVLEVAAPSKLAVNTTYHVVSTFDGTTGRLYVNGVQVATGAKTGSLTNYTPNFGVGIGDDTALTDPTYAGTVDEVAIYAGTVLTAAQVLNHYNAGTGGSVTTPTPSPSASPSPAPTPTPIVSGQYGSIVLADAPSAFYELDDTGTLATDKTGHGYNGTIGSSVTKGGASLLPASTGSSMGFPGTASSAGIISVKQSSALQPSTTVSLEAWLKFATTPPVYTTLVAYGTDFSYAPYSLFFRTGGQLVAQFYLSSGVLEVPSPTALAANKVYYVASTYDGTTGRLYVNGVLVASGAKTGTLADYTAGYGLTIGDDAGLSDPAFKGSIDEVAVYAGKTLSAAQIQNHYTAGTSGVSSTPAGSPTPPAADWLSFGFDLQRTGYNPVESTVGISNVSTLKQAWTFNVGSSMVHEPVLANNVNVSGQLTNILYAGSQYGATMYAINTATSAIVWQDAVPTSSYNCGTSASTFGIGETPAIDRGKNRLYFSDGINQVHAVDLATGKEAGGWPITIANYTPDHNFMHGGLTYNPSNGMLYAVTGSTCDISPWYGRIVAINTSGPSISGTFYTMTGTSTQGASGGGIWGPGGASIDPATNDVFVATGNADTTSGAAQNATYAEQVVELSPTLGIIANNYPENIPAPAGYDDFDFGATPLLFEPAGCPAMLAAMNKSGMLEVYDRSSIGSGPVQYIQMSVTSDEAGFSGVPAYDPATNYMYVGLPSMQGIYQPGLAAFSMQANCTLNPTPVWSANFGPAGTASVQAPRSPISIANGVVYVANYTGDTQYAFNAATGSQLWSFALSSWGNVGAVIDSGTVFVGAADGTITAFALPAQATAIQKRVVKSSHSVRPAHRASPRTPWAPWIH